MITREIADRIHAFAVDDRTTALFEGLWPIRDVGITYNSYLVRGKKNVLIDLTNEASSGSLFDTIATIVDPASIDYVVVNHMEPDHTAALKTLMRIAPKVEIICTPSATPMLASFYGITKGIREVQDGEELDIGGRRLAFHHTPLVHWPETMVTYEPAAKVLFSADIFGGYGSQPEVLFDDESADIDFYLRESLRYYTNIIAKFSPQVARMVEKLRKLPLALIAPGHGLLWRKEPQRIVDNYAKWAGYAKGNNELAVTLLYASMYGNTAQAMNAVVRGLGSESVPSVVFDVAHSHLSHILPSLWTNAGVIIGSPTYEGNLFPSILHLLTDAGNKNITNKKVAFFGSWSWSSGALREAKKLVEPWGWEIVDTLEFEGAANKEAIEQAFQLGASFARHLKRK